jgi:hypothetical protein
MNPRIIQVRHELSHEQAKRFKGLYLDRSHYDTVVGGGEEDIDVITADSRWVLSYRYSPRLAAAAEKYLPAYLKIDGSVKGRGSAVYKDAVLPELRKDGTTSRCERMVSLPGLELARSVNIGYEAGNGRNPYAHPTKFVREHPDVVRFLRRHMRLVDQESARVAPQAQAAQMQLARRIPDWTHPGTSFSSWIYNNWWRTAGHYDRRMFGPSVLTSIIGGAIKPDSGRLIFPRHRVAVQLRTGSLLLANTAQELHGNDEILAVPGEEWWRVTLIGFLRPQLLKCGTRAVEEEKRQRFLEELKERRAR